MTIAPVTTPNGGAQMRVVRGASSPGRQDLGVDVFLFSLDGGHEALLPSLNEVERTRALGMQFERDRVAQIRTRGVLRRLLGERLRCAPSEVRIQQSRYGKPYVAASPLHFNVSHSGRMGVVAIGASGPVGIDIEGLRPIDDWRDVAKRFFAEPELRALVPLDDHRGLAAFLRCFVRKEAYAKALGTGIGVGFDGFALPDRRWRPGNGVRIGVGREEFLVVQLPSPPGYVGALAARPGTPELRVQEVDL